MKPTALGWMALACMGTAAASIGVGLWQAVNLDIEHYEDLSLHSNSPNQVMAPETGSAWQVTKASFYGSPYDDGKRRVCADGKTLYSPTGAFCATRLVPLGTMIEVRRGETVLRLRVADTQAPKYGHLIDLPTKTWDKLGAPRKQGKVVVEWRVAK